MLFLSLFLSFIVKKHKLLLDSVYRKCGGDRIASWAQVDIKSCVTGLKFVP